MTKIKVIDMTDEKLKPLVEYESQYIPRIGESWQWGRQYRVKDIHWIYWGHPTENCELKLYVEEV